MNNSTPFTIQFLGASGTVTGSKYLIETDDTKILIDCGLFQGLKELRDLNWKSLPLNAAEIDVVLLTHGHLDHTGYLPKLVDDGFTGHIIGTQPTLEITKIILADSARIQEEDAEKANKEGSSKHSPAKPLYNLKDVEKTLPLFYPAPLDQWIELNKMISYRFNYNGHIIGSTFIELKIGTKTIVFSGDIGTENDLLLYPPKKPEFADVVLIESTYGNRFHPDNIQERLAHLITKSLLNQGTIIIPSFAVERTQLLMYLLSKLKENKQIPEIPIYMDSPMGATVLNVFEQNTSWHKLSANECRQMSASIQVIRTIQETYKLAASNTPKIIIAGAGMASGGRVLTYFVQYLGNPTATILFTGYQAEGTRGRALLEGASEVKIFGKYFPVKANIESIEGLSAHADQKGLMNWLSGLKTAPTQLFIVHGEKAASEALREKIQEVYTWKSIIPELNQVFEME